MLHWCSIESVSVAAGGGGYLVPPLIFHNVSVIAHYSVLSLLLTLILLCHIYAIYLFIIISLFWYVCLVITNRFIFIYSTVCSLDWYSLVYCILVCIVVLVICVVFLKKHICFHSVLSLVISLQIYTIWSRLSYRIPVLSTLRLVTTRLGAQGIHFGSVKLICCLLQDASGGGI